MNPITMKSEVLYKHSCTTVTISCMHACKAWYSVCAHIPASCHAPCRDITAISACNQYPSSEQPAWLHIATYIIMHISKLALLIVFEHTVSWKSYSTYSNVAIPISIHSLIWYHCMAKVVRWIYSPLHGYNCACCIELVLKFSAFNRSSVLRSSGYKWKLKYFTLLFLWDLI